jgi:hypothetical protein
LENLHHDLSPRPGCDAPFALDTSQEHIGTNVACEDDYGVLKVYQPPLTVCQPSVVHYLQKHVPHLQEQELIVFFK